MIYIDLDGVLANWEKWMSEIDENWDCSREYANKIIEERYKDCFKDSEVISENLKLIPEDGDFRILTARPYIPELNRSKHCRLLKNKIEFCKKLGIPPHKVITVNAPSEKLVYCEEGDILYDDNPNTIKEWNKLGGIGILI